MDYRIVGGHMVTLLVAVFDVSDQVPMRETADADFAALPEVVGDPRLPAALQKRGYVSQKAANRFIREYEDAHGRLDLVIDILAPSFQGILLPNQQHGELFVDEVPGLAPALNRPAMSLELRVRLTGGEGLGMRLTLPDLQSAICVKALAYQGRFADKDAVDLWRLMNAAHAAGLRADHWPASTSWRRAAQVLHRFFGRPRATGLNQISRATADQTRMQALVRAVVAEL
ncbi:MAG TPA: hypothetical protein VFX61_14820 [Micromonosporaceae bacterium]|nr:hypothetical protein [Micromonosporaceae bacterium]